jgi:hypothetical protein
MELINFAAWIEAQKVLTSSDVDTANDQIVIGKKVNNQRDGSQYQSFAMSVTEFVDTVAKNMTPATEPKVYKAILNQSGTDAPVAVVGTNTLGGTVTFTRDMAGNYQINGAGLFTVGKTFITLGAGAFPCILEYGPVGDGNQLYLATRNSLNPVGSLSDDKLYETAILIEVFP